MFRLLLTALATLVVVRVLFGLVRAIGAGMREGRDASVGGGRPARPPTIDRNGAIDVSYTEIRDEEPTGPRTG
jgi:hypothetical protein